MSEPGEQERKASSLVPKKCGGNARDKSHVTRVRVALLGYAWCRVERVNVPTVPVRLAHLLTGSPSPHISGNVSHILLFCSNILHTLLLDCGDFHSY